MRTAVEFRDAAALEVGAHTLRGSIGTFGAVRAGELAAQLEKQGKRAEFADAQNRLEKLEREINLIHAALADYTDVIAVA
jgi:HPt (histidine-containing phosphotransfer) domain-containing protein